MVQNTLRRQALRRLLTSLCAQGKPTVLVGESAVLGDLRVVAIDMGYPTIVLVRQGSSDEVGDREPVRLRCVESEPLHRAGGELEGLSVGRECRHRGGKRFAFLGDLLALGAAEELEEYGGGKDELATRAE